MDHWCKFHSLLHLLCCLILNATYKHRQLQQTNTVHSEGYAFCNCRQRDTEGPQQKDVRTLQYGLLQQAVLSLVCV